MKWSNMEYFLSDSKQLLSGSVLTAVLLSEAILVLYASFASCFTRLRMLSSVILHTILIQYAGNILEFYGVQI